MQRENEQQPWAPIAFYSKCLNAALAAFLACDFEYVAGPLKAAAAALSRLPVGDKAEEVCAILPADIPRHWDEKELLAAQEEDHLTLAAGERLASTPDFSWAEKRGGPL